jgi:DNA-binding transcriptional regulator YdaS (Cro superfamily)
MIERLGGVRKTASALGIAPTTVQHWKIHDRVPPWRSDALRAAYTHKVSAEASA